MTRKYIAPFFKYGGSQKKVVNDFSFFEDLDLIYTSFIIDYKIDLRKDPVDMKTFVLLLQSLSEKTPLMNIIKLRNTSYKDLKDENLKMLKRKYSLKQTEDSKIEALSVFQEMVRKE